MKSKIVVVIIYIVIFIAISLGMTLSDNSSTSFEQTSLNVCVFDEDDSSASHALIDAISQRNKIVEIENDRDVLIDALYYERANYVLTIKKGFEEKLVSGDTNETLESMHLDDTYSTVYMGQYITEYVSTARAYMTVGNSLDEALEKTAAALAKNASVTRLNFSINENSVLSKMTSFFFRFMPYNLISVAMNTLCPILLVLTKKDIRYRTLCSGIHPTSYTMQTFAGSTICVLVLWLMFMIVGLIMNGGMFEGYAWLAALNSFIFMIFATSLTVFISSLIHNENSINIITQIIGLGMCFLSGVFVSQDLLGEGVLNAARFLPAYWYVRVNNMLDGTESFDTSTILVSFAIVIGYAVLLAALTILVRKQRSVKKSVLASA